ncbi:hypothetical protein IFR05_005017 [Cadophora sp. M221]|nr:hypothetical protein IFR05_005017 [Cadophora sp. M221]
MVSPIPDNTTGAMPSSLPTTDDAWANLPPLHTIKSEELIRYQIVDWDPNNPYHPHYLEGRILIKSLFQRNYYYWISCSNPLPKAAENKAPPPIFINSPTALSAPAASQSSVTSSLANSNLAESQDGQHGQRSLSLTVPMSRVPIPSGHHHFGNNVQTPTSISSYTHPVSTPSNSPLASTSPNINSSPPTSSAPTSVPSPASNLPGSQKKRTMKSKQQQGRNVRAEFGRATLNADGKPSGVEKPAEGFFNLGAMSWHFRNVDEGGANSKSQGGS